MLQALILEDQPDAGGALVEIVRLEGFEPIFARTLTQAREALGKTVPDVALVDLVLPDGSGLDLISEMSQDSGPDIVVITGHATVDTAVEAIQLGAQDYLVKPIDVPRVRAILAQIARNRRLRREVFELRTALLERGRFGSLVGISPAMRRVFDLIERAAPKSAPVFVTGESGTGKEEVAKTLHELGPLRDAPFVPVNCAAVPRELFESELFGHERGSFTGAHRRHRGYFEQAEGGTLFLDEIGEMPIEMQPKLLRVVETNTLTRVGAETTFPTKVRLVAATNRPPEQAVREGLLREDLFYRLNVFRIDLPPLRERAGDVELLVDHFLSLFNRREETDKHVSPETLERLTSHAWPGNVRELRNVLERAFWTSDGEIGIDTLPATLREETPAGRDRVEIPVGTPLQEANRRLILATLRHAGGDKKQAAETLGISLKTLYNRLREYDET